jgi:hypothetical protein
LTSRQPDRGCFGQSVVAGCDQIRFVGLMPDPPGENEALSASAFIIMLLEHGQYSLSCVISF